MSWEIRLLGSVELYMEGQPVALGPPKRRAMFAALVLPTNQRMSLDRLAEAVWVGPPPRSAIANLRTHAAALRRILGDRIVAVPAGYQLRIERAEIDADEFLRLASEGRAALNAGNPQTAALHLTTALSLWHGPAAGGGLPRGTWLDAHFIALDEQRLDAFEDLVDARLAMVNHGGTLPALRQHLAHHPLRERAWAQLILALYRAGDPAAALTAFRRARTALRDALGVEPGPELLALQHAILERDPALSPSLSRPTATDVAAPDARRRIQPSPNWIRSEAADLISRTEELAAQLAALAAAMRAAT